MKWIKTDTNPSNGDIRVIEIFCLLPRSITTGKDTEYRWLETVQIKQRFHSYGYIGDEWVDIEFLN